MIVKGAGPPGAARAARDHQRSAGSPGRAGDTLETRCADPAVKARRSCLIVSATCGPTAAPSSCPPSRTPSPSGQRLGEQLRAGDVVVLSGPLGAGKTALTKGIALGMDVEGPVTSPTFVLARVHRPRRAGYPAMVHVDVYRLLDRDRRRPARRAGFTGSGHRPRRRRRRGRVGRGAGRAAVGTTTSTSRCSAAPTPMCGPHAGSGTADDAHRTGHRHRDPGRHRRRGGRERRRRHHGRGATGQRGCARPRRDCSPPT